MITLEQVSKGYPNGFVALKPTSLCFEKGSFTVLLGPSGAGKSTLLRCINFLNTPSSGRVSVEGLGLLNGNRVLLRSHRRRTAMIFQQHQLIDRYSALDNVLIGRIGNYSALRTLLPLPRRDHLIALESLDRVGLLHKATERVDNLSGGQQQRVGIARGLAQQPTIILADEPVASLDPATSAQVLSLLHSICKEDGLTAIVSLHQVELAKTYADRVIGLANGEVVFDGDSHALTPQILETIYHKPHTPAAQPLSPIPTWQAVQPLAEA
ncbi:MAG: phosphonate ABC transporter ATP-binding protein [Proteobacteria bacterium]|nr:phosphonate ABC transporter ATP-binding protein [Pseudomonadota bacterium]MBU1547370.1 phosphonate ABC transporter ATP-binding protein [Pseudomonadota bacterium]MBU2619165.1 phosphonate ABC transporter ATP-binding protein [Pseudomonadota bacterium]